MRDDQYHVRGIHVCWIGNHRYDQPLNPTDRRKWQLLRELGITMSVIAFNHSLRPHRSQEGARFYLLPELPGAPLRYLEMALLGSLLLVWLILRRRVAVIVAQSPFEGAVGALAKTVTRLAGQPVALVTESHGDFEVAVLGQRKVAAAGLYRRLMSASARYAFRHTDVLRAVSGSTAEQLRRWIPGKPIVQFMAWTDAAVFRDSRRTIPPSQTHDLVYAGRLIPLKGVHTLIDAFAQIAHQIPDAHLWLVGEMANQDYTAQLKAQVERLGLTDRITFRGAVEQRELAGYLARSRAMVLVSSSEGLPRVVIEAMLNGTPVIASRVSGTPEVIEDGVSGYLVPPEDVPALVEALRRIYANPDIDAMSARAKAFAEQFFSEDSYVEGHRRLLALALNPSLARAEKLHEPPATV